MNYHEETNATKQHKQAYVDEIEYIISERKKSAEKSG